MVRWYMMIQMNSFLPTKAMNTSPVDMEHKGSRAVYGTRTSAYRQNHWNSDEGEDTLHK